MRKPRKSPKELQVEMNGLKDALKAAQLHEEVEFGRLARKIGILDLDLSPADMKKGLEEMRQRFRGETGQSKNQQSGPVGEGDRGASTANG